MSAGRTKKKIDPLAGYAAILRRVEQHAKDMRERAEAEERAIFELVHGCGKKNEDREDADQPKDTDFEDMEEIHMPLAVAMREGGDPFHAEWTELRGALAKAHLPEIRDEAKLLHDSFVALFPTHATKYGWQAIEDEARSFASFLDGLPSAHGVLSKPNGDGYTESDRARAEETHKAAQIAAARKLKELEGKSAGGRKGAAIAKAERGEDPQRKAILDEAKNLLKEWDRLYPDRHKSPKDMPHANNAAFRNVAYRYTGADGEPIMKPDAIRRALDREKAKNEGRGKYDRTGRKRGRYKTRT